MKPDKTPCAGKGLDTDEKKKAFAHSMKRLQSAWSGLKPEERQQQLTNIINHASPTPRITVIPADLAPGNKGSFNPSTWTMKINQSSLDKPSLSDKETSDLGSTLYHETRHSEQSFLVAKNVASTDPQRIGAITEMPDRVTDAAKRHPIKKTDAMYPCSELMRSTTTGVGGKATDAVEAQAVADNKKCQALLAQQKAMQDAFPKIPTDAQIAQYQADRKVIDAQVKAQAVQTDASVTKYAALPVEQDAFATGDSLGTYIKH